MQAMSVDALAVLGLILTNGLLAMSRSAIESAKKSRLNNWSSQGDRPASAALRLSKDPRRLDWTVQLLVTVLTTFIGVYAGTTLVPATGKAIGGFGGLAEYKSILSFWGVVVAITLASLVFSELVPRRLASFRPEQIARLMSFPIRGLSLLAVPVMSLLSSLTDLVFRAIGIRPAQEPPVTQEEISLLLQEGTKAGVFEEGEHEMIKRVFRFCDRRARALMTPRSDVIWLDIADSPEEIRARSSPVITRGSRSATRASTTSSVSSRSKTSWSKRATSNPSGSRGVSPCLSSSTKERGPENSGDIQKISQQNRRGPR